MDNKRHSSISFDELQHYSDALFNQVTQLKEENKKLRAKVADLETHISNLAPVIDNKMTNEEFVAINEIAKLKLLSETQPLTLDDTKRLDTYVKILQGIRAPKQKEEPKLTHLSTDALLSALDHDLKFTK